MNLLSIFEARLGKIDRRGRAIRLSESEKKD